jgi:hypothetical protein
MGASVVLNILIGEGRFARMLERIRQWSWIGRDPDGSRLPSDENTSQ